MNSLSTKVRKGAGAVCLYYTHTRGFTFVQAM